MYDVNGHFGRARRRSPLRDPFVWIVLVGMMVVGAVTWRFAPLPKTSDRRPDAVAADAARIERSVYYPGCNAARAAGVAPIYAGSPGYRPEMDGDGDGIACEWHPDP